MDVSRLSMDDIEREIEEVAKNGEGAQKLRALMMLRAGKSELFIPNPLSESEQIDRMVRLMKPLGANLIKVAFQQAFAQAHIDKAGRFDQSMLSPDEVKLVNNCVNLPTLYRIVPRLKKPGIPTGFPRSAGKEAQAIWCQNQLVKILVARHQEGADAEVETPV